MPSHCPRHGGLGDVEEKVERQGFAIRGNVARGAAGSALSCVWQRHPGNSVAVRLRGAALVRPEHGPPPLRKRQDSAWSFIKEVAAEAAAAEDFVPYAELVAEVTDLLVRRAGMEEAAAAVLARDIVDRAQFHLTFGSNRQNVLGEGFEDLLKMLAVRVAGVPEAKIALRRKASELPGFQGKPEGKRRIESPDMAIIGRTRTAHLSTVKWSLRHDRQKQLTDELDCYVQLCSQNKFPEYVLVTNEYDPGRLKNSSNLSSRGKTVDRIYHINPDLLVGVLSDAPSSVAEVRALIETDRVRSLEAFLSDLRARFAPKKKW